MKVPTRVHVGFDVDLSLPEEATARELLTQLADRIGPPFEGVAASPGDRIPENVRVYVGGIRALRSDERVEIHSSGAPGAVVLLLSPVPDLMSGRDAAGQMP